MRKNSTDKLSASPCFRRICLVGMLLFASVYMLLTVLPFAMVQKAGLSFAQTGWQPLCFMGAMLAVGPFHARLGDVCKRKHVLLFSVFGLLVSMPCHLFASSLAQLLCLAVWQGACFGLAAAAGITVAIDVVPSSLRTVGNLVYAWVGRLGMLLGMGTSALLYRFYGFEVVVGSSMGLLLLALLIGSKICLTFRAPIGVPLCSIDRFFLPRAWLPAVNLFLFAFACGVLLPLLPGGDVWTLVAPALPALLVFPLTKIFVNLSHHCQRGTANTTAQLAMECGLLAGLSVALVEMDCRLLHHLALSAALAATLLFTAFTWTCYKRKRVR